MPETERVDRERTGKEITGAAHEVRGAVGRRGGGGPLSRVLSAVVGAAFALRGARAVRDAYRGEGDAPDASLPAAGTPGPKRADAPSPEANSTAAKPDAEPVTGPVALAKELYSRFQEDDGFVRAAALAFFGILSLVPVLLFALAALGFLIRDEQQAAEYVRRFVTSFLPGKQASEAANAVIAQTNVVDGARALINGRWTAAVIGVVSLLWTATTLLANASAPMNAAWDVKEARPFWKLRLVSLALFLGTGLFFASALAVTSFPEYARHLTPPNYGLNGVLLAGLELASWAVAIALNVALFTILFRFLPDAKVSWRAALAGGVVTGVLWEFFKQLFTWYVGRFGDFNKTYGALGGIVLLITWIYYSCVILLLGAEISKMWYEHREGGIQKRMKDEG